MEIIVLKNRQMTDIQEKNKQCQRDWNRLNTQEKGQITPIIIDVEKIRNFQRDRKDKSREINH